MNKVLLLGLISIFMVGCASTASDSEIEHFETVGWNQNKKLMVVRQATHINKGGNWGFGAAAVLFGPATAVALQVAGSVSKSSRVERGSYLDNFKSYLSSELDKVGVQTTFVEQPDIYGHDEWFETYKQRYSGHPFILGTESWIEFETSPILSKQTISMRYDWTIYNDQGVALKTYSFRIFGEYDKETFQDPSRFKAAILDMQNQSIDEFVWKVKDLGK